jgi:N-acetylglucosamine-6-phosphate deacetylase
VKKEKTLRCILTTILYKMWLSANDLQAELIIEGEHYDYLAMNLTEKYKKRKYNFLVT